MYFKRLEKVTDVAALTPEERRSYEADVKNARDALNQFRGAWLEGYAEGLAKARAEVIAKGRAETHIRIARNMLAMGLELESISEMTGLPIDVIENL